MAAYDDPLVNSNRLVKAYADQIGRAVPRYNGDAHIGIPDTSRMTDKENINAGKYNVPCGGLTAAQMPDQVNSPSHYTDGGIETIDFIEAKKLNYNLGNVVKYISRAGKKNNYIAFNGTLNPKYTKTIEDLEKAAWYLAREIKTLKGK